MCQRSWNQSSNFFHRVVGIWNDLYEEVVEGGTITTSKRQFDRYMVSRDMGQMLLVYGISLDGHLGQHGQTGKTGLFLQCMIMTLHHLHMAIYLFLHFRWPSYTDTYM